MDTLKQTLQHEKTEGRICFLAGICLTASAITLLFSGALGYENIKGLTFVAFNGIFLLLFFASIKKVYQESTLILYLITMFVALAYLISLINNWYYLDYYFKIGAQSFLLSIPWMFATFAVSDYHKLKSYLLYMAYAILFIFLINLLLISGELGQSSFGYSQAHSYALLPPTIIFLGKLFEKITIKISLSFIISLVFMISMGARGPLLCLMLYYVLKLIIYAKTSDRGSIYVLLYILVTMLVFPLYEDILTLLREVFAEFGLSIRLIDFILEKRIFEDSARIAIRDISLSTIADNVFIGVGVGADRLAIARYFNDTEMAIGLYPHNFFLEILLQYGVFIGFVLIGLTLFIVFNSLFCSQSQDLRDITCIYFALGFLPLLISGSYLTFPLFWAFIGVCLSVYKTNHTVHSNPN